MKNFYFESDERRTFIEANSKEEALEEIKTFYKDEELIELREENEEEKERHILQKAMYEPDISYYLKKRNFYIQTPEEFFEEKQSENVGSVEDFFEDYEGPEQLPSEEDFKKGNYSHNLHEWLINNYIKYGMDKVTYLGQTYFINYIN